MGLTRPSHAARRGVAAASAVALVAAFVASSPASADKPTKVSFDETTQYTANDICSFPVTVDSHATGFTIDSAGGSSELVHVTERDTFSANGRTLVGLPFTFNTHVSYDAAGNPVSAWATGQIIRVPLSQGVTFRAAGRFDFVTSGADFVTVPQSGGSQHRAEFCAALAG